MESNEPSDLGITYEDRNGYLYAFFSGKREGLEDAKRYWQAAAEECSRRGYKRLLVEQYFTTPLSRIDTFYLAEYITHLPARNLKVAFVDRDLDQKDINQFAETVVVNRGGVGKVFSNFVDAEVYLLADTSSE